jgi:hypothetical protein
LTLAKPILDTFVKPKLAILEDWFKNRQLEKQACEYSLYENKFHDYLLRTIEKSSIMSTLIFPNQQIFIEDIYQPLTLIDNNLQKQEKIKIETFPQDLFDKYQKVLICDSAGMGKSTLSRYICLQAIKENCGIPVFIELRKINSQNTIIQEFLKQLNSIDQIFDKEFIMKLLKLGEFFIVMDGFDEIANEEKENVTQDIREFVFNCNENYFLLTSRPEGAVSTFGDFKITNIKGLRNPEAFQLLEKFDILSNANLSESLISEIKGVNNQVQEFLVNPFLVSLLYKTYSFKRDIPSRKSTFYNEVYTALYQDHDLSKDSYKRNKNSRLDIQDFRLVLREFANHTAKKGEIDYENTKAIQYLTECKSKLPFLSFKEVSFVEDLLTTVPLFIKEGNNIKWAHKSFQDYFAAEYITNHPKKDLIINYLINKDVRKYQNIIELVIELDPNLIRHYVIPSILKDLIAHFDNSYDFDNIPEIELSTRRMITFDNNFWVNRVLISDKEEKKLGKDEFERVESILLKSNGTSYESATKFSDDYFVSYTTTNRAIFVQLLGSKGLLGKSMLKSRQYNSLPLKLFTDQPVLISDKDSNSNYNLPEYFSGFNKILTQTYRLRLSQNRFSFVPDINYCKRLLESIEIEITNQLNDSFLNDY